MDPRTSLAGALRRLYALGLTTTSGGNLSLREPDGRVWITRAGGDKGSPEPRDVVLVGPDGSWRGEAPPSSELPFHRAVHAARPELGAVVHAHPVSLVAFSVVHQVPDSRSCAHAHALCGPVGFAPYARPGSAELGERIGEAFAGGADCVMLENHGVVVGARDLDRALERLEALDRLARVVAGARQLGGERILDAEALGHVRPRRSAQPRRVPETERPLCEELCALARRGAARGLLNGVQGAFSARLGAEAFLLTPSDRPFHGLEPGELLRSPVAGAADPVAALHAALYRAHPWAGAILQGLPEHAGAFCVSGAALPSRTIPESYLLLRDPRPLPLGEAWIDPDAIAARLARSAPVGLVENEGGLCLGATALEAFDRLEVLEASAAAVLASRPLGPLAPLDDTAVHDLREAFPALRED